MRIENENINNYYNNTTSSETRRNNNSDEKIKEYNLEKNVHANKKENNYNEHEVIEAIEKANKQFKTFDRRLEFSIHEKTKQIIVKVIDTDDDTVLREIPSEKILDMVAKMWELSGIFVDEKR